MLNALYLTQFKKTFIKRFIDHSYKKMGPQRKSIIVKTCTIFVSAITKTGKTLVLISTSHSGMTFSLWE